MPSRWRAALLIASILLFAVVIYAGMQQTTYAASVVSRVSVATDGTQGTSGAYHQAISGNGRFVVFTSDAPNLVPGDTNNTTDIFLRDTQTGTTTRVSITSSGAQATGDSYESEISDDGRFIVFASLASNLTTDHHWFGIAQVYLHDMQTGTTVRVSNTPNGAEPSGESYWPDISADGRYISFVSVAPDLITGGYNHLGIYVRDMQTSTTTLVSVASDGTPATFNSDYASISANGRFVVFQSEATNLVPGDTNGYADVFLHDRKTGTTSLVSIASNGTQGNGHSSYFTRSGISTDGGFIAFDSRASNLVTGDTNTANDVFVRDVQNGTTTRVSLTSASAQTNLGSSDTPTISGNGRYVVFASSSPDLVPNDTNFLTDIFVRDLQTGITTRVSLAGDGTQQNASSEFGGHSDISSDGSFVIYGSRADNLVSGDTNNSEDIFLVDWQLLPVPVTPTPTPTATSTTTPTPTSSPTPTSTPTLKPPSYTITSTSDPLQLTFGLDALLDKAPSGLASVTCDVGPCAWAWSSYLSGDIPGNGAATVVEWNGYFYLGHAPSLSLELYHGGSTKILATLPSTEQQWPEIVASAGDILTARITMSGSGTLKLFHCDAQDCTPSHIRIATHGQLVATPTPTATSTPTTTPTSTPTWKTPNYTITSTSDPLQLTFGLDALLDKAPSSLTSVTCDTGPCAWEWSSYLSGDVPGNGGSTIFHWGSYFNLGSPPSITLELRHTGQTTVLAGWSSADAEGPEVVASAGDILTVRITMGGSGTLNLFHCNGAGDDCTPMYFSLSTRRQLLYLPLISNYP